MSAKDTIIKDSFDDKRWILVDQMGGYPGKKQRNI